ncbi:unnamed protein product [Thelazia callipaeda]|uniref:SH3 domain-containing protein n=1 Tax=Thelazia callipaeda TaxID=103827 RepID=A0A0N5D401_THECL|nr:unnamed protein product [Thelazia callipaeda]
MSIRSATVQYSYKAAHEDELNLEVNDVIDVLEEAEAGWMKGELRSTGQIGLFPTNFVQFLARVLFTYSPKHDDELALREVGQVVTIVSKSVEDAGWFVAEVDGKRGLIPDGFVEILRPSTSVCPRNQESHKVTFLKKINQRFLLFIITICSEMLINFRISTINLWKLNEIQMPPPPNMPVKLPPKSAAVSSSSTRRATTSSVFAQMHSSLADAFTKPPKQFSNRSMKTEEKSAVEIRPGDRLSHITTTRPKQPNKRPPSTILRMKSNENAVDDTALIKELGSVSPMAVPYLTNTSPPHSLSPAKLILFATLNVILPISLKALDSFSMRNSMINLILYLLLFYYLVLSLFVVPAVKSMKTYQNPPPKNADNDGSGNFVTRSEYQCLLEQLEGIRTEMNKFRVEMSQKISTLEAQIIEQ